MRTARSFTVSHSIWLGERGVWQTPQDAEPPQCRLPWMLTPLDVDLPNADLSPCEQNDTQV